MRAFGPTLPGRAVGGRLLAAVTLDFAYRCLDEPQMQLRCFPGSMRIAIDNRLKNCVVLIV